MERLTEYFECGAYTDKRNNIIDVSDKLPLFENGVIMGKAIDKLAEFEDFMEEWGFVSLDSIEAFIQHKDNLINGLFTRWEKLKEHIITTIKEKDSSLKYYKFREVLDKMQELEIQN